MPLRGIVLLCAGSALLCAAADHIVLQVEDFGGPWRVQTNISGFLGAGFCTSNANPAVADSTMQGSAAIEQGGSHAVWVRAYTSDNSRRALQAEVNGTRLDKTHTGKQRRWGWERAGAVDLSPGPVSVTIHDADDGFESADAILLTDKKDYDPNMDVELQDPWLVYRGDVPNEANALEYIIEACCAALAAHGDPEDRAGWDAAAPGLREALGTALGLYPLPERTPLNARVAGRAERDGYFVENVVFESRPGFLVTANVYVPKGIALPAPAVVVAAGHDMKDGKNCPTYQMAQLGLIRNGFVVLALDPIGQGERRVPGFDHPLGYGSLLVGATNEGYIVWDTIRAVDYLVTRDDVIPERIGLAGNSGGGECTFYTMPFDERFAAAGSFCFVCSYEQWFRHGGNHCICNHFPGIVHLMEEFQIIGLNAPRPFLMGNGEQDKIFPIEGTRTTFKRAQRIYAMFGAQDALGAVESPTPHGWERPLREACYGWMTKWLKDAGDGSPIPEGEYEADDPSSPDLLCFDGNGIPADSETVVTLNRKQASMLSDAYPKPPENADAWHAMAGPWRERVWATLGGQPTAFAPAARVLRSMAWRDREVQFLGLQTEPDFEVAALQIRKSGLTEPGPALLYLPGDGKAAVQHDPDIAELLDKGWTILAIDPRGTGETEVHENHLTSDGICLGRPIFAQRIWDVLQAARYLAQETGPDVYCWAQADRALMALYASALESPFAAVFADRPLASYRYYLEDAQPQPISLCVPRILEVADIPQIIALAAPARITLCDPIGYGLSPLIGDELSKNTAFPAHVYAALEAGDLLSIVSAAQSNIRPAVYFETCRGIR